jgi:hypothetical protein
MPLLRFQAAVPWALLHHGRFLGGSTVTVKFILHFFGEDNFFRAGRVTQVHGGLVAL